MSLFFERFSVFCHDMEIFIQNFGSPFPHWENQKLPRARRGQRRQQTENFGLACFLGGRRVIRGLSLELEKACKDLFERSDWFVKRG